MKQGLFITFEGGEGAGKTTQIKKLSDWMTARAIKHVSTKEPGCPDILECKKMRKLLLDPENNLVPTSELLLFLADRAQHVAQFIRPNLKNGIHVICDRYSDSTRVYQWARGLNRDMIDTLLSFATTNLDPDLTLILDIQVKVGLERAKAKSIYKGGDRMENAGIIFHEDVRHGFLKLAESVHDHYRFRIIDASPPKTIKDVHEHVVSEISKKLWTEEIGEI